MVDLMWTVVKNLDAVLPRAEKDVKGQLDKKVMEKGYK